MMSKIAEGPVRTFTIGMSAAWDEAPRARALAEHLGTVHTEIRITEQDCLDVIPALPRIYTEPFGDSSQIPTYVLCRGCPASAVHLGLPRRRASRTGCCSAGTAGAGKGIAHGGGPR